MPATLPSDRPEVKYYNQGLTQYAKGLYTLAIMSFNRVIELDPGYAYAYYNRGQTWLAINQDDKALADFSRAIEIRPNYAAALYDRSLILERQGRLAEAAEDMKRLAAFNPYYKDGPARLKSLREASSDRPPVDKPGQAPPATPPPPVSPKPAARPGPRFEKRTALVMGNGSYKHIAYLKNPANDADDMARALKRCGFNVRTMIDGTRREMIEAMRAFGDQLKKERNGVGLFFYAGHGVQIDGENHLVPVNARVERKYEVEVECLKVSALLGAMENADNRLNIIILDACRNNPFRGFRGANRGLAQMTAPAGSILIYSTAPGEAADDGPDQNGLYTSMLLKHIMDRGLTVEVLLKRVRIDVMEASGGRQVPWESSSLTGNFYFMPDPESKQ